MIRRRSLGGFFKFFIDPTELSFIWGKQKTLTDESWLYETGTVSGTYSIDNIDGKPYWKIIGNGPGHEAVIFINFKTSKDNQIVEFKALDKCASPNDFLAIGQLDSINKSPLKAKLNNNTLQTISFTVPKAGSHFIKVYYYQHNDADNSIPVGTHGTTHEGWIRLEPYYNEYAYGYENANESYDLLIKSYTGWTLVEKPTWVILDKQQDRSGKRYLNVSCKANPGLYREGYLILKEKRNDRQISILIKQDSNPHPYDIILSMDKSGGIVNEKNNTIDIGVTLIGETSYTISNVSSNYSVTKSSDGKKITVKNNTANISGQQNVSFKVTGNNGTVKDVLLKEDYGDDLSIECYCDCNAKDVCGCDIETNETWQTKDPCGSDYKACDKDTYKNSTIGVKCPQHSMYICNGCLNSYGCSCYGGISCTTCYGTKVNCSCKSTVTCNKCHGSVGCSCNSTVSCNVCHSSVGCSCNSTVSCNSCHGTVSCSCHNTVSCNSCHGTVNCYCHKTYTCNTCHGSVGCSCNSSLGCSDCKGTKSCSGCHSSDYPKGYCDCHNAEYHDPPCDCFNGYSQISQTGYIYCSSFYHSGQYISGYCACYQRYNYAEFNGNYYVCGNTDTAHLKCYHVHYPNGHCGCYYGYSCTCHSSYTCNSCYGQVDCSCHSSVSCNICHGAKVSCSCNSTVSCNVCHGAKVSCSCNSTVSCNICHSSVGCSCNNTVSCNICHGTKQSCTCHSAVSCTTCNNTYACTNCHTGNTNCNCNSKKYHPYCDCDQYCPCEGYVIPVVN